MSFNVIFFPVDEPSDTPKSTRHDGTYHECVEAKQLSVAMSAESLHSASAHFIKRLQKVDVVLHYPRYWFQPLRPAETASHKRAAWCCPALTISSCKALREVVRCRHTGGRDTGGVCIKWRRWTVTTPFWVPPTLHVMEERQRWHRLNCL